MNTQGWRLGTSTGFRLTGFRAAGIGVLVAGFVACAGDDTPPVDNQTRDDLAAAYPDPEGQEAAAGSASSGGGAAGAAGSDDGAGGRAGSGQSSAGTSSGTGGGGSSSSGQVCDAFGKILTLKCNGGNCHGDGAANGDFAASEAAAAAGVDQESTRGASCGVLIDPADTADSLIYKMVAGTQDFGACFPVQMPLSGDNLTPAELDCVEDWLTQFAD